MDRNNDTIVKGTEGSIPVLNIPGTQFDTALRPGVVYEVRKDGSHKRLSKKLSGAQRRKAARD